MVCVCVWGGGGGETNNRDFTFGNALSLGSLS